ncbi:translocation/assembly module TamB domain-containing protein [Ideonella sp.]|uniref:translocation/assembly module TamB domain-containing protein n=1 Tax=Ideonella sp. TaxID=1929293 RepID=UPI002C483183|nr:translocation/assembly module TamB domain-containing protein [Ramlibacter sp.]
MSDSPSTENDTAPAAPTRAQRRWLRRLAWSLGALLLALVVLVGGGVGWLWRSEPGTHWLLTQVPGLKLDNWRGALGGDALTADRLTLTLGAGELVMEQVSLDGLRWTWRPDPQAWAGIAMNHLSARSARWHSKASPAPATPSAPPPHLRLPIQLRVDELRVAGLQVDSLPLMRNLQANLHLGAKGGSQHQIAISQLDTDRFQLSGAASLLTEGTMALQSQLALHSPPGTSPAWQAKLTARGPLADLAAEAELQGQPAAGKPAPSVQLQTRLQPFAPWPLGELNLKTEALDLAALLSDAPHTALRGSATLHSSGLSQPAQAELNLHNDQPGRWDEQRLPVRELSLSATGTPQPLSELRLTQLNIEWASGPGSQAGAGRWTGDGRYLVDAKAGSARAELALKLQQWQPAALDKRLPALLLSGPIELALAPVPAPGAAAEPASAASSPSPLPAADPVLSVLAKLTGQLQGRQGPPGQGRGNPTPPVSLQLDTQLSTHQALINTLELKADAASASLKGRIERSADARLRWQLAGQLQALDLRVWLPGAAGSTWQQAPQQLNASLDSEASLPESALPAAAQDPSVLWRTLRGQLALKLAPSTFAGLPLQGSLQLKNDDKQQQADAELLADDAKLQASWHDDPGSDGRGSLSLKAPHLATLAPLARLQAAASAWAPSAGGLDLQLGLQETTGKPDHWQWRADGTVSALQAGALKLDKAQLHGKGDVGGDWPLDLQLDGSQLIVGQVKLNQLKASLAGGLAQHQLQLALDSPVQPPNWLQQLAATGHKPGAKLQLQLAGHYARTPQGSADWTGQLSQLQLRGVQSNSQDWFGARELSAQLHWEPDGRLSQAALLPGELSLLGTALQWSEARFSQPAADRPPLLALQAKLKETSVAPLLQRLQPDAVWAGDLKLGGQLQLRYDGKLEAEAVVERLSGDLALDEDGLLSTARQLPLGLTDLRLSLKAHDGSWQFTQALAGQYLGALGAALSIQAAPDQLWPATGSPMQGTLTLQVTKLSAWAPWMPAGWRLGGELASSAKIAGTLGAPEIAGELTGQRLSLQNPLLGVSLTNGQARLLLEGQRARLEQLAFKGGDGSISATGTAELGAKPSAKVSIEAQKFKALGRIDRTIVASGQAQLGLDKDTLSLNGNVTLDEGLIDISRGDGPTLPEDVVMARTEAEEAAQDDKANGQSQRVTQLALQLDLGQKLRLRGKGIDTGLQGALKITNPRGKLAVVGTVRTAGGNYAAYGQKLSIERGSILFNGPVDDPRLDIYAIRPNLDVQVGVLITGTALNPRVRLASDTEMSDTDKLSWLVMGRAPEGLGQADTAMLQRAALALLMGNSGSPTDNILENIGLSDFSLRQAADANNVQTTVVTVGKQLTRRWYVGYERGVNAAAGTWQLIYRIAQRFTLRAQSGEDSALDAIWTWRWD